MADILQIVEEESKKQGIGPDIINELLDIARAYSSKDMETRKFRQKNIENYIDKKVGAISED
jgi:hypothetical protein